MIVMLWPVVRLVSVFGQRSVGIYVWAPPRSYSTPGRYPAAALWRLSLASTTAPDSAIPTQQLEWYHSVWRVPALVAAVRGRIRYAPQRHSYGGATEALIRRHLRVPLWLLYNGQ
jgi:hypothetical protein